jgi:hypothetical protein
VLEGDGGPALAAVIHDAGVELDLAHALAVRRALEPCRWAEVNAALMLHEAGASEPEVRVYLKRWSLSAELAAHMIRYITEPTQRTYVMTLAAGRELCRSYVAGQAGALPPPADRAGARARPARGTGRRRTDLVQPVMHRDPARAPALIDAHSRRHVENAIALRRPRLARHEGTAVEVEGSQSAAELELPPGRQGT